MKWMELHIDTTHAGLETVETMLSALGIDGVVIDDEEEFQDFLENNHQYWDYVDEDLERRMQGRSRVTFYLESGDEGFSTLAQVRLALEDLKARHTDCGSLLLTMDTMEESDWENNWKQYYKPMEIGQRLLVLDLGCGSGILSIAALKLGAKRAVAVDIDDKCLDVAYENAAMNGIGKDTYTVLSGDILSDQVVQQAMGTGFDLVVANIVADVIIALSGAVDGLMAPGGRFLCSGIIDDRAEEVAAALEAAGLAILERHEDQGWFCFLCCRKSELN